MSVVNPLTGATEKRDCPSRFRQYQARYKAGQWRAEIFRDMVLDEVAESQYGPVMLDIGCGNGFDDSRDIQQELARQAGTYIGLEPDPNIQASPCFDVFRNCTLENCDLAPESVDIAFSVMVLEHVQDPVAFWKKLLELLKPGGVFWGFTMDRRHFFCLASTLAERFRFKELLLNRLRGRRGVQRYENYPTWYRANSPRQIQRSVQPGAKCEFVNFGRVGQLDFYYPGPLVPVAHGIDRTMEFLGLPGSLLAIRIQKPANATAVSTERPDTRRNESP